VPHRLKVLTVVGTRPEIIKLSRVISELSSSTDHVLVHTGQNFDHELNEIFFQQLEVPRPHHFLNSAGNTPAETIANVITRIDTVLAEEKPDAFLLLGDTNSCLSVIAAKRRKIPVFHMEAGNRCFDDRVPEEINRRLVDHLSDINLPYTEHARRYLLAEGIRPDTIIKTGSPMREVLNHHADKIAASTVLKDLGLKPREYFVVSCHREENVDDPAQLQRFLSVLHSLGQKYRLPIIVSTHPRTKKRLEAAGIDPNAASARGSKNQPDAAGSDVRFLKPQGFFEYVHLQQHAQYVLSDSGTLTEEAAICGFPGVMIREAHERPEGMDEAVVVMTGMRPDRVLDGVELAIRHAKTPRQQPVADYASENVSRKVCRIILSYTDFVNRTVWKRDTLPT
jgi:UDP-N-acetylglucosamine 2-epimerase (non-hydrolysing)